MFNKKVVFIFGRFQVPTKGHAEMIQFGADYARRTGAEFRVYTSKSHDPSKNPLPYQQKIAFLRQIFPGINIVDDPHATTAFAICKQLSDQGIEDVTMITGGDRVREFQNGIGKYVMPRDNPKFDKNKNYAFKRFTVVNSGGRKEGVSGTQMRQFIRQNKFSEFMKVSPTRNTMLAKKIFKTAKEYLKENELLSEEAMSRKEFDKALKSFVDYTCGKLGINEKPVIKYKDDGKDGSQPSFGGYAPHTKELIVVSKNRHPMDIFRTVAHELVHHKQNEDGRLGKDIAKEGSTGSDIENEANAEAGKIMRYFGRENPFYFDMQYVTEHRAIILGGTPGSGKDKILKEAIIPLGFKEVSDSKFTIKEATGENLVVSGTMFGYEQTKQIKHILECAGYKTIMVFVNTSNEVSKQRNEARATSGGRVICEANRFAKWKTAQDNLDRYDKLFEKVIEVKNDFNANDLGDTWSKLIESVTKEIYDFALSDFDRRFEQMLEGYSDFGPRPKNNPVGGAGNWGTDKLTNRYKADTPGQEPGKPKPMKVLRLKTKMKEDNETKTPRVSPRNMPIGGDRIGDEIGYPKSPTFGDNQTIPTIGNTDPIARWMMKEETKKKFRERYGSLAEQKIRETASKLAKCESLDDPYAGGMSDVSVTGGPPEDVMYGGKRMVGADQEKTSLFGKRKRLNTKKK